MPRRLTQGTAGLVFHVMNRGARQMGLFGKDADYRAWFGAFAEAQERIPIDVFSYCLMPNHFHLVLRPMEDGQLAEFMRLGTLTHSMRWHRHRGSSGGGVVYQGRYRSCPVQTSRYFYNLCRYVEANALRAALVNRAEDWPWSSLAARCRNCHLLELKEWPISQPSDWVSQVNAAISAAEVDAVRHAIAKGIPLGSEDWSKATAVSLGLLRKLRNRSGLNGAR